MKALEALAEGFELNSPTDRIMKETILHSRNGRVEGDTEDCLMDY